MMSLEDIGALFGNQMEAEVKSNSLAEAMEKSNTETQVEEVQA
jgi:hypothetical protein